MRGAQGVYSQRSYIHLFDREIPTQRTAVRSYLYDTTIVILASCQSRAAMRNAMAYLLLVVLCIGAVAGQTITVSRTSFLNNDPVTVTLSVPAPTGSDAIGLYPAGTVDTGVIRPLKCVTPVLQSPLMRQSICRHVSRDTI